MSRTSLIPKGMLNTREVAERFQVSQDTVRRWRELGAPHYKIRSHYVVFDPKEIKQWIKKNYTPKFVK